MVADRDIDTIEY